MSDYYYLEDKDSDCSMSPVPGDDYAMALLKIAKEKGVDITDKMVLDEIFKKGQSSSKKVNNKTYLYIDGTNLFAGQNELFGPARFLSFIYLIQEIKKLIPLNGIYFYASYMSEKNRSRSSSRKRQLIAAEALFYREVKHTKDVTFYQGHRSPTSGKEKGVDVHLSVDIVKDVFQGKCAKVVIITGDADLIYPLEIVKRLGISTTAIFLPNRFSLEMAYKTDNTFVLNFLNKFDVNRKLPKQLKIVDIKKPRMINIRGR